MSRHQALAAYLWYSMDEAIAILLRCLKNAIRFLQPEDMLPEQEKDIWHLDKLDIPKTVGSVLAAFVGAILQGVGLCFVMVFQNMLLGIVIGLAGIAALLMRIPLPWEYAAFRKRP